MGNLVLKCVRGDCTEFLDPPEPPRSGQLGPHGLSPAAVAVAVTIAVSALAHDLLNFDATSQVPEGLSRHVTSSKKEQANWYEKLLEAWKQSKPPPKAPEEATNLVALTLKRIHRTEIEGLLAFYGLPPASRPVAESSDAPSSWPQGVKFELHTLPVNRKCVVDGDGLTVYVDTADPRESANVPREVHEAAIERTRARAAKDYAKADALHKSIIEAGYRVLNGPNNEEKLARKYRIRLRGVDAPEGKMPYGRESKDELSRLVQGKRLKIHVYGDDQYGRCIGDVYCDDVFIQEQMLKRGFAWHYAVYDRRPEFAKVSSICEIIALSKRFAICEQFELVAVDSYGLKFYSLQWEREASSARRGLWASSNPEKPWEWRKDRRNAGRENNVPIQVY